MIDISYRLDLRVDGDGPPPCVNHPNRTGSMWRQSDGARVCIDCWREDNIQAPITMDDAAIRRAERAGALSPHESYALRQRKWRKR